MTNKFSINLNKLCYIFDKLFILTLLGLTCLFLYTKEYRMSISIIFFIILIYIIKGR